MEYSIASTDENHYNRIRVNLPLPSWKYSNVMITSCVTNCNILVLKKGDHICFNIDSTYYRLTITANIKDIKSAQTFELRWCQSPQLFNGKGQDRRKFSIDEIIKFIYCIDAHYRFK